MLAVTGGEKSMDFPAPQGISLVEVDESSGGGVSPYCPRNLIVQEAFKVGTEPSHVCPTHSGAAVTPVVRYMTSSAIRSSF